ncbi:ATP-binding cassette domain-containing protein [Streptomyces sp. XM4193]|uniref:ATP-binding cassette domain-containing protein n=1 Tax=Streptomyces sp. XM4193 TaxID=2929782 RepID=UPI001FF88F00|nr:ATP-binding cassette domain-containing protein [Streptomyces sp. XM4193]MCK1798154.1 ATP-binding cassette domain-containing protein [Streptomyces sp. XM4193]
MPNPRDPVEVHDLHKSYDGRPVLRGVDFTVERGRMYALLGPNGAGKTTTVRILATLLDPDGGAAHVGGFDVVRQAREVRNTIGLTGQYAALDLLLTGRENLVMMGRLHRLGRAEARRRAEDLIERLDLGAAADRPARTYSGGMRRRLDLAAGLIAGPRVLFLDEPTTGLDPRSRATMWELIKGLLGDGTTILLTTQYLDEADQLADRVGVLDAGAVVAEGTPEQLKERVGTERLELCFADRDELRDALRVLDGLTDSHDEERLRLTAPVLGPRQLHGALDALYAHGIEIERVGLSRPTLDDVFLSLTGGAPADTAQDHRSPAQPAATDSHSAEGPVTAR